MPSIQNQHLTPTALHNITFLYFPLLFVLDGSSTERFIRAEFTAAEVQKANKDGEMLI